MDIIIQLAKLFLLAYLWTRFTPLQMVIENVKTTLQKSRKYFFRKVIPFCLTALQCFKCSTFWLTLIVTGNIYFAILNMVAANLYTNLFSFWEHNVRLQ